MERGMKKWNGKGPVDITIGRGTLRAAAIVLAMTTGAFTLPAMAQEAVNTLPGVTVTASRNPGETPAEAAYTTTMATRLGKGARYPSGRDASLSCPSGTSTVWVELARTGKVVGHGLQKPSGSQLLDQQAVQLATRHKYAALPTDAWTDGAKHRFEMTYAFDCAASKVVAPGKK